MKLKAGELGAHSARALLDGVELVGYCIEADEEAGEVVCLVLDDQGRLVFDGEELRTETKRGVVRIELAPEFEFLRQEQEQRPACSTCEGSGEVFQEHQAGCWVGGAHPCPDCHGKGE